ncbi:4-hydroxy-tetrahydrodipicolinate reductase [Paludibacter sp.]|uniref:4-hydroxy-tetrahydrodipicolinate reductase n=1 Tax=Paludibacter sp. TaxID=1898105 RepID=UPI001354D596|nr:4-hydroxy-tetrahydrodipicolinate reductase [Paludibacter sp.]MTK52150.1 4-hydroxy-tetrahydrodipicolinate reductase [Paludibacter sp.]
MRIALIGYGKMGHEIEQIALNRGHEIVSIIDMDNTGEFDSEAFRSADVAIEFTRPEVAMSNLSRCFDAQVPVVCGTTGWTAHLEEVKKEMAYKNATLFWASNFSLGVNIFAAVNRYLAKIMNSYPDYNVSMVEVHHTQKLDAPSGTAITLAEGILDELDRKSKWVKEVEGCSEDLAIVSKREGAVPGIHEIIYESEMDVISIKHDAKTRRGFALGAVLAAEFTAGKKGFITMSDLLPF